MFAIMSSNKKGEKTESKSRDDVPETFEETKSREEEWKLAGKKVDENAKDKA
jgi:hypothetical protein